MLRSDVTLTKRHKNQVFDLFERHKIPHDGFSWLETVWRNGGTDITSYDVSVLKHTPTGFYCTFAPDVLRISPGFNAMTETHDRPLSWETTLHFLNQWLPILRDELTAPDLWAELVDARNVFSAVSSSALDNRSFSVEEQGLIASKLDELQTYVLQTNDLVKSQKDYVRQEFTYLKDSSKRFGRKDWIRLFMGVIVSQIVTLALHSDQAKGLLSLAGAVVNTITGTVHNYLP